MGDKWFSFDIDIVPGIFDNEININKGSHPLPKLMFFRCASISRLYPCERVSKPVIVSDLK